MNLKETVSIITSDNSFPNNYGAALQGYALYKTIEELGYSPSIIGYIGGHFEETRFKEVIAALKRPLANIYHKLKPSQTVIEKMKIEREYSHQIDERSILFNDFIREMTFFNKKRMYWSELKKHFPQSYAYICGSDQIWNPYFKNERNDPGYFLKFAPEGSKKIAYAPSFGCNDLPLKAQKNIKELLSSFNAISVRENSGVDLVTKYTGLSSQVVLDPTLLRTPEQWESITRMPNGLPEHYILCYRFADSTETKQQIDKISEEMGLPVYSLPLSLPALRDEYKFIFNAGPREFVGLIRNADLVCTDSYHATVFSILMKTPVYVFLREEYDTGDSMNSRLYSLLENLKLNELIYKQEHITSVATIPYNIMFDEAHRIIEKMRKQSMDFLESALRI